MNCPPGSDACPGAKVSNRLARRLPIRQEVYNAGRAAVWELAARNTGKSALRKGRLIASTSRKVRVQRSGMMVDVGKTPHSICALPGLCLHSYEYFSCKLSHAG